MFKKRSLPLLIIRLILSVVISLTLVLPILSSCSFLRDVPALNVSVSDSTAVKNQLLVETVDVGQGDCLIIKTPDNSVIMVDAGEKTAISNIVATFKKYDIEKIDLLIATHPHSDHIGGMQYFVESYPISKIMMPKSDHSTSTYINLLQSIKDKGLKITEAKPGLIYQFGDVTIDVLGPISTDYENLNNISVVFKLTYGSTSFLFTGDAGKEEEKDILDSNADISANVLKVGHHGSSTSTSQGFLDAVSPSIAIASCGLNNEYGHPHKEFLDRISKKGIKLYRTDLNGGVSILSDGTDISVETEK